MLSFHKSSTFEIKAKLEEAREDSTTTNALTIESLTMEFREFIKSRFCKPLVLAPEDEVQDVTEWRRLVREDQERQFAQYGEPVQVVEKTDEERRVEGVLAAMKILPVPVLDESQTQRIATDASQEKRRSGEARESTKPDRRLTDEPLKPDKESRGGQKFDKVAYQREYMRKRRAAQKEKL